MGSKISPTPHFIMKIQFKAKKITKDGKPSLQFDSSEYKKALLEVEDNTTLLVTVSDQRTLDQNKLLHSCLNEIAAYTGESLNGIKAFLKMEFLGYEEYEVTSYECYDEDPDCEKHPVKKKVRELRSTTSLTKKEFADFITQIQAWAWENLSLNLSNITDD